MDMNSIQGSLRSRVEPGYVKSKIKAEEKRFLPAGPIASRLRDFQSDNPFFFLSAFHFVLSWRR